MPTRTGQRNFSGVPLVDHGNESRDHQRGGRLDVSQTNAMHCLFLPTPKPPIEGQPLSVAPAVKSTLWLRACRDPGLAGVGPVGDQRLPPESPRNKNPLVTSAPNEDAALMAGYCDGDLQAFHRLYARLAPRIFGYLLGLTGERALAEDLLQQTFLKVHQARASYVRDANPVPWFYMIAQRTFLDQVRKHKNARVMLTINGEFSREPRATLAGQCEVGAAEANASAGITVGDLEGLPQNQKEALILTKMQGHSLAEAALIAGSTPSAIKSRAHRAYTTLRERLARRPGASKESL